MKKKKVKALMCNKKNVDPKSVTCEVGKIVIDLGFQLRPSAGVTLKNYCKKAVKKGLIQNEEEAFIVTSALAAAGIRQAKKSSSKTLNIRDIDLGWREELSVGPGNCPPYFCSRLSIIDRQEVLRETLKEYNDFFREVGEGKGK